MTLEKLFAAFIFLIGFVYFEPAPADLIFIPLLALTFLSLGLNRQWFAATILFLIIPMLISALLNPIDTKTIKFLAIDIYMFSIFMVVSSLAIAEGKRIEEKVFNAWTLSAVLSITLGSLFYLSFFKNLIPLDRFGVGFGIRLMGFHKDPNVFGPFLIPPLLYQIQSMFQKLTFKRICIVICLAIGIFLSFSRAALLNVAVCSVLLFLQNIRHSEFRRYLVVYFFKPLIALSISFFGLIVIDFLSESRLTNLFSKRLGLQSYDQHRFSAQSTAFRTFLDNPIFGVGPGNIESYSGLSTHSMFLRFLVERGGLGFLALMVFCSLFFYIWVKNEVFKNRPHIPIAIIGIVVNSFFIDSLHWRFLWVLLGLSVALGDSRATYKPLKESEVN